MNNITIESKKIKDGTQSRVARAKQVHRNKGARAGIKAYCQGNKWLQENARAVGNM
ncbi:MAG: hypothetical protein J7L15_00970 [Clostridiales bacterium]|nr:hypothetical protein [Clostridiales bacterium]